MERHIMCIDLKSFFASCECVERNINPFTTPLVVANPNQGKGAITLAITPYLKSKGIKSRTRLYEIPPWIKYEIVPPRMSLYIKKSKEVVDIYLEFVSEEDLHIYSIDECFLDVTHYLKMYGMSDKFGMMCLATVENQYLDGRAGLICGEDTAGQIDKEVLSIINNSYNEAMQMLTENREILDHISEYLYEKETITGKEFMKIFREMKGLPQEEDKEALMPDDTEKDKKDSKAAFVSDDMFED